MTRTIPLIINPEARAAVIASLKSVGTLIDLAPSTEGRLPVSYGDFDRGYISVDRYGVRRFYTRSILVHEERIVSGDIDPVTDRPTVFAVDAAPDDLVDDFAEQRADEMIEDQPVW